MAAGDDGVNVLDGRIVGMMALIDFEGCERSRRFYSGNAGRKVGVVWDGGNWILKFPGPAVRLHGSVPSYTTAQIGRAHV